MCALGRASLPSGNLGTKAAGITEDTMPHASASMREVRLEGREKLCGICTTPSDCSLDAPLRKRRGNVIVGRSARQARGPRCKPTWGRTVPYYSSIADCVDDGSHFTRLESIALSSRSTPSGITQRRIKPVNISLNLLATSLVYDLAPHRTANIGQPVASRSQVAPDTVDAFTEDNLYPFGSLAQNYDVQGLSTFGYMYLNLPCVH